MLLRLFRKQEISYEQLWSEVWNLFKFGVVGVTSLALNAALYWVLSRLVWPTGPKTLLSVTAVAIASIYNFSLHRSWTFKSRIFSFKMLLRYGIVTVIGTTIHGTLFYIGHEIFGIYDLAVVVGAAFFVATATYCLHRWFTFHPRFG